MTCVCPLAGSPSCCGAPTPDVTLAYDAAGNRIQMADGSGTETYAYDELNRLTSVTRGSTAFDYLYDSAGNVTRRTYPDATVVDYTYDDNGRLGTVTTGGASTSYGYDPAGNLLTTTLPSGNGHTETRGYDRAGRLTELTNANGSDILSKFTYGLDPVGNPTSVVTPTGTSTYSYDELDRLTEVCFQASCGGASDPYIRWTYDSVGNRTAETRPAGTKTYTYNDADQLTTSSESGGTTYTYDADGNQTAAGSREFTYDLANRLSSTTNSSTTITYAYDGDGKRLMASSGNQAAKKNKYLWDPNHSLAQLAAESDGRDVLRRRYVHGADLVSMFTGGANHYYHHDPLGSVANLTSATGAPEWTYEYEPFGITRTETQNDSSAPINLMRFTGELFDVDSGLYHLRARQYDPVAGRFLGTDPWIGRIDDPYVASYAYVGNRPTSFADPTGRIPFLLLLGLGALLGAGANSTAYTISAAVDDNKEFTGKGLVAAAASGAIAGAGTVATGGLSLLSSAVAFGSGALASAVGGSICGGISTGDILRGGLANAGGNLLGKTLFPSPVGKHVAPSTLTAVGIYGSVTGSVYSASQTESDSCGNATLGVSAK